jgi:hypothetical membrane protein
MKSTTIYTILMVTGLSLLVLGVFNMPEGNKPITFAWYYVVAITGLLVEIIALSRPSSLRPG